MLSRTSRILFVVALLAVGAFVFFELPGRRARDRAEVEGARFVDFDASRADGLAIERPDASLRFELRDANWDMTAPVADVAEPAAVAALLRTIETAEVARDLGPGGDPAVYGLGVPAARVTLTAGPDTLAAFELGGYTVDRAWVYARRQGEANVLLVPTDLLRAARLPADDFRNRRVVAFELAMVGAYSLANAAGRVQWERGPAGSWFARAAGGSVPGDSVAVEAVLRRLRGMRVAAFVPPADTAGAFVRAAGVVRAQRTTGAPLFTVRFAPRDSSTWARVDGESRVVVVDGDVEGLLAQSLATLRDRRLLHFAPARARRIAVTTPDTAGVLVRAGGAWSHPNPALGALDPDRTAEFVRGLRGLRWTAVADLPLPGTPPVFSLVVAAGGDTILDELRAWPRPGGGDAWIASSRSSAQPRLVDGAELDRIAALLRRVSASPRP